MLHAPDFSFQPPSCDVCVVGAGPIGIAVTLALEDAGLSVLLIESGEIQRDVFSASLSAGHGYNPLTHASPTVAMFRGLGGTSRWWGGRCVAFDDIDFEPRQHVPQAVWPISHDELSQYYADTATYFGIGRALFSLPSAAAPKAGNVTFDTLERWTPEIDMGLRHRKRLESSPNIHVMLGVTVVELSFHSECRNLRHVVVAHRGNRTEISPRQTILACGGLETARLLLTAERSHPGAFEKTRAHIGRGYMGHASGKIADLILNSPSDFADYDFFLDNNVFVRRRFTLTNRAQQREHVLNTAFWIDNAPFSDPNHYSGILSLVWLALALPFLGRRLVAEGPRISHVGQPPHRWEKHLRNILLSPVPTLGQILRILRARFISRPRKPGFIIFNKGGRYALHFHAEQAPNLKSHVSLSDRCDAYGTPFLEIDLQYSDIDGESVVRSHEILDVALREAGLGRLAYYHATRQERLKSVMEQASDGYHHIGLARMSTNPDNGVVDSNCRVHGIENLWLAGSAVMPTSGQANPTFVATALALRLARHLAETASPRS